MGICIVSKYSYASSFSDALESLDSSLHRSATCSVDTELICRNDSAQNHFNVFFATVEMNRLLSFSFAS